MASAARHSAPEAFERLLDELSELSGLDKSAARVETLGVIVFGMDVSGTTVCITCPQGDYHTHFNVLVEAGSAPDPGRADQWRALMEANFALASNRYDACFCCDEEHQRLQLRFAFRLAQAKASRVMSVIRDGVHTARLWRATGANPNLLAGVKG